MRQNEHIQSGYGAVKVRFTTNDIIAPKQTSNKIKSWLNFRIFDGFVSTVLQMAPLYVLRRNKVGSPQGKKAMENQETWPVYDCDF